MTLVRGDKSMRNMTLYVLNWINMDWEL